MTEKTEGQAGGWHTRGGVVPMLAATACFATMNVFVRLAERIPFHQQIVARALVTLVLVGAVLAWRAKRIRQQGGKPWGRNRLLLMARGAAGTLGLLLYFYTLHHMPLATAVTVQHLSPLFTLLISAILLREPPRWIQIPFFLLALAGVMVVKGVDTGVTLTDLGIGVAAAFFAGLAYNIVRMLKATDPPLVVVFWFPLVSLPLVLPWSLPRWVAPTPIEWVWLLGMGLTTMAAQVFLSMAYQRSRASEVSALNYLGVLYALVLGRIFFHEAVEPWKLVGVGMIVVGIAMGTRLARARSL